LRFIIAEPAKYLRMPLWRSVLLVLAALLFVAAGVNHFLNPTFYLQIIPPIFPAPAALMIISGACEIAGGVGLLIRRLRRAAGWGLIALLIAVFPANIYMVFMPHLPAGMDVPVWALWLRLPLQAVFIGWVWLVAIRHRRVR
jgi:uncharacterized membrane protein